MKILITGATGFIGRNLIPKICGSRYKLAALVRNADKTRNVFGGNLKLIPFRKNNLRYKEEIKAFGPEIVLHLASYLTSGFDTRTVRKILDSNIEFGTLVLDALTGTDVKYFINTGSFSEYAGGPKNLDSAYLYSATKTAFRSILGFYKKIIGFKVITVTPYTIYGPGDTRKKAMDYIIQSLKSPLPITMSPGKQVLDFIHIDDLVDFYQKLIGKIRLLKDNSEYHLGTGTGASLKQVALLAEAIAGRPANIAWGVKPYRKGDIMHAVADITKAQRDLGWKPKITLKQGMLKLLKDGKR